MKKQYTNIGIWGFGISGKAILRYVFKHFPTKRITILDKQFNLQDTIAYKANSNVIFLEENDENRIFFLNAHDLIIPSPGIDLRPYKNHQSKFYAELDLFYNAWQKPIIGITGTVGKTSITHLLSVLLPHAGTSLATGGNIGTGMLDLVGEEAESALLELSSFQLEQSNEFIADIGVITNLYPNHLDRHETMEKYLQAKYQICARQNRQQKTIVPLELVSLLRQLDQRPLLICSPMPLNNDQIKTLTPDDVVYYFNTEKTVINKYSSSGNQTILTTIPGLSYEKNWLIIAAVLDTLGHKVQTIIETMPPISLPEYRLEHVATIDDISFYNDSKATILHATIEACKYLISQKKCRAVLILGGISKGVDRTSLVHELRGLADHIICFGGEATSLYNACLAAKLSVQQALSLEDAVAYAYQYAKKYNGCILFSPGGASFDLFKDYKDRGEKFKNIVMSL